MSMLGSWLLLSTFFPASASRAQLCTLLGSSPVLIVAIKHVLIGDKKQQ